MNTKLKEFLDFIVKPESRLDTDNYVASRKITDNNLSLVCGYLNGAAWISGIAFDRLVKIRFNYFENSDAFYVGIDGVNLESPVSKFALDFFFTNGALLGHPDQPATLRPISQMRWGIWEAVCVDVQTLELLKLIPSELSTEAAAISKEIVEGEQFTGELKARACKVEFEVGKYRAVLEKHYSEQENKDTESAINSYR